jgi:hypothetical protein
MQTSAIHDPYSAAGPSARERAEARRQRLARIAQRAYGAPKEAQPQKIEIKEYPSGDTAIEVTACNGQVVIVTEKQVAEARAVFESVTNFGGGSTSIDKIQRVVCKKFGLTRIDFLSRRRTRDLVIPRQIAMYLCKTLTFKSLPEIGRRFNGKDHTTVLHAVRKIAHMVQTDEKIRDFVAELQIELGGEVA